MAAIANKSSDYLAECRESYLHAQRELGEAIAEDLPELHKTVGRLTLAALPVFTDRFVKGYYPSFNLEELGDRIAMIGIAENGQRRNRSFLVLQTMQTTEGKTARIVEVVWRHPLENLAGVSDHWAQDRDAYIYPSRFYGATGGLTEKHFEQLGQLFKGETISAINHPKTTIRLARKEDLK
jgi:hypothetical protein